MWEDLVRDASRFDKSNLDFAHGLRAALLVVAPLIIGLSIGHPELIFVTLGAFFITNTEGPNSAKLPLGALLFACIVEPLALGVGTLVGLLGLGAIPLVGLGVFLALSLAIEGTFAFVGRLTAIVFAVGVGLPGGSEGAAFERLWLALAGALIAFLGTWVHRSLTESPSERAKSRSTKFEPPSRAKLFQSEAFRDDLAIGLASSLGFAVGLALGLPRDFWIVVTIISSSRPRIGPTLSFTLMMVIGTIAGAIIAAAVTLGVGNVYVIDALLLVFAIATFATRGVNLGLTQVFITPFIIILLNLLYPGESILAGVRILDVAIGGAISIAAVYLLWTRVTRHGVRIQR